MLKYKRLWLCVAVVVLFPATAYAYVDPGSGGAIITAILGAIGAIGYTFRKYYYKIKNLFFGEKGEKE